MVLELILVERSVTYWKDTVRYSLLHRPTRAVWAYRFLKIGHQCSQLASRQAAEMDDMDLMLQSRTRCDQTGRSLIVGVLGPGR